MLSSCDLVARLVDDYPIPELNSDDVAVEMMMCPINPADINQIQGVHVLTISKASGNA